MHYYLYKLKFNSPVHFGADKAGIGLENISLTCHADTLFSAICHEVLLLNGESEIKYWHDLAYTNKFLISDLFPYLDDEIFLPKPVLQVQRTANNKENEEENSSIIKKKLKKLKFIPISKWDEYLNYLKNGGNIPVDKIEFAEEEIC